MRLLLKLALALSLLGAGSATAAPQATIVQGRLEGASDGSVDRFLGIPYASPPVGELRWRAPRRPAAWTGVRPAVSYGADCMQNAMPGMRWKPQPISEDCLYLNVWRPAQPAATPRPVMVWIHGGGFSTGSGAWPIYEGSNLAKHGVVVVTINYRLNRFGFFAHPALMAQRTEEPVANYGLMDQVAALRWVHDNIAAFGGDPANVTIFGESAGGFAVNYLLTMPSARGLFAKAIVESGGGSANFRTMLGLDTPGSGPTGPQPSAIEAGRAYAASLGVTDATPAALRAIPAAQILGSASMTDGGRGPVVDGKLIVEDPVEAFAAGRQARVPFIIGSNSFEASILPAAMVAGIWNAAA
ncbi:MAG: carboxylesterase, partial [Phenylobacterium sp.]|nr:carboxylesterase [Phenylobacterium sp.]